MEGEMWRWLMLGLLVTSCAEKTTKVELLENCKARMEAAKKNCINNGLEVDFGPKAKEHNAAICVLTRTTPEDYKTGDGVIDEAAANRCDFERMTVLSRAQKIQGNYRE
jgi:hypothetical protein